MFIKRHTLIALICSGALAACGGGGGEEGGTTTTTPETPQSAGTPPVGASSPTTSTPSAPVVVVPAVTWSITTQPQNASIASGANATFSVAATASGATSVVPAYQWLRDGAAIAGATSSTYTLTAAKTLDSGAKFSVTITAGAQTLNSSVATLTVAAPAVPVATGPFAYPIMFVTSVPGTAIQHQLATFGNHSNDREAAVAGGDLFIRYTDGTLRNLTQEAGWGVASGGIQGGPQAIAVRQPSMHWDGKKAVFSMQVGGPTARYQVPNRKWQLYEVTGLGKGEKVVITKVANQPAYNNISPVYGSDDNILFVSDAPLFGMTATYPQLDEYESMITNTGIWKLNVATGTTTQLQHAPSGSFDLFVDSFGRVLFTKWDHLQRDQQADGDRYLGLASGAIDYPSETATTTYKYPQRDSSGKLIADAKGVLYDVFPGARNAQDPTKIANENLYTLNQFFVWQVNEDGSNEETINHVGRHEMGGGYQFPSFNDDPNLNDAAGLSNILNAVMRRTFRADAGIFQLREDVTRPGVYLGTYSLEFGRQASGRIVEFTMPPGMNPENLVVKDYTNETLDADPYGASSALATMTGHYRNPLRLTNGDILVSHTPEYRLNGTGGSVYKFQLKLLKPNPFGKDMIAGASLTGGIVKDIRYWTDAASPVQYVGPLNENDVIEVRPRTRPTSARTPTPDVEKQLLAEEGVNETELKNWLKAKGLALIVSRNVTLRDRADTNQPFNLQVKSATGQVGASNVVQSGKVYDINAMQIFQADLTRGYGNGQRAGRRVYAKPIHNHTQAADVEKWYKTTPVPGSTVLGSDGSMAAFVPAGRALTWQLVSPVGKPVVRERVWVSFAPGEVRVCASCHGINSKTTNGLGEPINPPQALRDLVRQWKINK